MDYLWKIYGYPWIICGYPLIGYPFIIHGYPAKNNGVTMDIPRISRGHQIMYFKGDDYNNKEIYPGELICATMQGHDVTMCVCGGDAIHASETQLISAAETQRVIMLLCSIDTMCLCSRDK